MVTEKAIIKEFSKNIKKAIPGSRVYLFGSRARGDNLKRSDFDFIVVSDAFEGMRPPRRLELVYSFWDYKHDADILVYTPEEAERQKKMITIAKKAFLEAVEV